MSITVYNYHDAPQHLKQHYLSSAFNGGGYEDYLLSYEDPDQETAKIIADRLAVMDRTPPIETGVGNWKIIVTCHGQPASASH